MAIPTIVLKTLLAHPHKAKDRDMSEDGTLRPRSLSCCIGNLFRRRFPSTNKLYLPAEKQRIAIEAGGIASETRISSADDPPPIYRTAYADDALSHPRLTVAPGVLDPQVGLNQLPQDLIHRTMQMNMPESSSQAPHDFLRSGIQITVPESLSRRFFKEKEILQTLWVQNQQQRQQTRKQITDGRETVFVHDNNTGTTYRRGRLLGKGGFAKCYELIDVKSNKTYAGKIISKGRLTRPRQMEKIIREVELHNSLRHPNVVEFRSFFEDHENVYMVLENCSRKTMIHMLKLRKVLTEPEVRYYMRQLVEGCRYIHGRRVIHRDLKLGNMLVNEDMQLKIADFGLATRVEYEGEKKMTVCGTPNYIAPEVLQKKGHSYEADIWAMGCIMFALLCGRPPFETTSLKETYACITSNKFSVPNYVSPAARDLICKLLHPDPFHRPRLDRIYEESFFVTGFTPLCLPPSCCEMEPTFTVIPNVRSKMPSASSSQRSEMKAIVSAIEQTYAPQPPKRSSSQRVPKIEAIEPPQFQPNVVSPFAPVKEKIIYPKKAQNQPDRVEFIPENTRLQPESRAAVIPEKNQFQTEKYEIVPRKTQFQSEKRGVIPEKIRLHQEKFEVIPEMNKTELRSLQHYLNLQRKSIQRTSSTKSRTILGPDFIVAKEKQPLLFVKDVSYEPQLQNQSKTCTSVCTVNTASSIPKQDWTNQRIAKEEKVFSACSPMRLFQALSRCLEVMPPDFNPTPIGSCKPLWVTKWVDYSNKYGFGFQLSDRTVGILFNDTTRLILSDDNKTLVYNDLSNKVLTFTAETAPPEQRKKVTLLLYFIQYMNEHLVNGDDFAKPSTSSNFSSAVFMKKWFRTDKAVVMYLNNGTLQVNFLHDHTKLIIGVDGQDYLVTYIDAERRMLSYRLLQLSHFGCSIQLDERMRYAHRMLENVMNLKGETV